MYHVAFSVEDEEAQFIGSEALLDASYAITFVIDRNYFQVVYFHTPSGIVFEIATNKPRLDRYEDTENLGKSLKPSRQHGHMRDFLWQHLIPIED